MTIFEFLKNYSFDLPKRNCDKSYEDLYVDEMNKYFYLLESLEDFQINQEKTRLVKSKDIFEKSKKLAKGIISVLAYYQSGYPHKAFEKLNTLLNDPEIMLKVFSTLGGDLNFYRARSSDNGMAYEKKEIFHIPFELRSKVKTQRYSIPGFPSLYLSDSIYTCWEEMKRPNLKKLNCSRLVSENFISMLEIPYPADEIKEYVGKNSIVEGVKGIGIDSLLINWPLYLACSIKIKNKEDPFKIEYVLPQLLLQFVKSSSGLDGIKYFSTNIDYDSEKIEGVFSNYVFPVKEIGHSGFCKKLVKSFRLTEPVSYNLIETSTLGTTFLYNNDELKSPYVKKIEIVKGRSIPYSDSLFGSIERYLKSMEDDFIEVE